MGRKFVRVALGGVRDEAEIRGHRRTYVGALPGRIVRAIREAGSMNPVVLLDEIDKVGTDFRGDPAAALLEVLDPAQNHTFRDHYLEVELDLSDVLFLATANVLETIPGPLLDRMELVRSTATPRTRRSPSPATTCCPRQLERAGLDGEEVDARRRRAAAAGRRVHPRGGRTAAGAGASPGCCARSRPRSLGRRRLPVTVGADTCVELPRPAAVHARSPAERTAVPGVATGLAVTGTGGDVLFIEASLADWRPATRA